MWGVCGCFFLIHQLSRPSSLYHHSHRGVTLARKGGYQLHGSQYKANATTLDLSAHNQIVRVDAVRVCVLSPV